MSDDQSSVRVSRVIAASADVIFDLVSRPQVHAVFDGSDMLRGSVDEQMITAVGDTFTIKMHRLGRDYEMINHVVVFEPGYRLVWEPSPGDIDTAGGDPQRIGVPSGYRWGFELRPLSETATDVTEIFECGAETNQWILASDGGTWINGSTTVKDSMTRTLEKLEQLACGT